MERWFNNGEMISHIAGIFKKWRDEPNGEIDTRNSQYDVLKVFFKKGRDVNGELKNLCRNISSFRIFCIDHSSLLDNHSFLLSK